MESTSPVSSLVPVCAKNLWHNPQSAYSPREFSYLTRAVFEHRGVRVFRFGDRYDYVYEGVTIMQRAGLDKATAGQLVDEVFAGVQLKPVADVIADHLRKFGHTPLSYSDASRLDAGERDLARLRITNGSASERAEF